MLFPVSHTEVITLSPCSQFWVCYPHPCMHTHTHPTTLMHDVKGVINKGHRLLRNVEAAFNLRKSQHVNKTFSKIRFQGLERSNEGTRIRYAHRHVLILLAGTSSHFWLDRHAHTHAHTQTNKHRCDSIKSLLRVAPRYTGLVFDGPGWEKEMMTTPDWAI